MAEEDCLSADGACEYAAGDTVCVSGGHARRHRRGGSRRGHRDHLLGDGGSPGSYGRSRAVAAVARRMVAGHYFLFSGAVFFLQNADVGNVGALRGPECLHADDLKYYSDFVRIGFFALSSLLLFGLLLFNYYLSCG